jgi:hypothetical protein
MGEALPNKPQSPSSPNPATTAYRPPVVSLALPQVSEKLSEATS